MDQEMKDQTAPGVRRGKAKVSCAEGTCDRFWQMWYWICYQRKKIDLWKIRPSSRCCRTAADARQWSRECGRTESSGEGKNFQRSALAEGFQIWEWIAFEGVGVGEENIYKRELEW